jgi:hypothetical protein
MSDKVFYCKICGETITSNNYSGIPNLYRCRSCHNEYLVTRRNGKRTEKQYWGTNVTIYGKHQIKNNPNEYYNETQRKEVEFILKTIGWKFNEKNGIWFDDKIKNKDGEWLINFRSSGKGKTSKLRRKVQNNGGEIPFIKYTVKSTDSEEDSLTPEEIRLCQQLYFAQNYTTAELVDIFGVPEKEIRWVILTTRKRIEML